MIVTPYELTAVEQEILLDVGEHCARSGLAERDWCDPHADWYPPELRNTHACFASLYAAGQLLESVGTTEPQHSLVIDVARNAFNVGWLVAQRAQLASSQPANLTLEIAVLSPLQLLSASSFEEVVGGLHPGTDGVFVRFRDCSATFLPTSWAQFQDATEFLHQLCLRAEIDSEAWPAGIQVATFTTQRFSRTLEDAQSSRSPR